MKRLVMVGVLTLGLCVLAFSVSHLGQGGGDMQLQAVELEDTQTAAHSQASSWSSQKVRWFSILGLGGSLTEAHARRVDMPQRLSWHHSFFCLLFFVVFPCCVAASTPPNFLFGKLHRHLHSTSQPFAPLHTVEVDELASPNDDDLRAHRKHPPRPVL